MGVSENSVPLNPMVLLIIIPFLNGYFIGNIPYFQTNTYGIWLMVFSHLKNPENHFSTGIIPLIYVVFFGSRWMASWHQHIFDVLGAENAEQMTASARMDKGGMALEKTWVISHVPMGHITQPLSIWSTRWLLFQVMSNSPKSWDIYQSLKNVSPFATLAISSKSTNSRRVSNDEILG